MGVQRGKKVKTRRKGPNQVKAHYRSPRGPDRGKPRVKVPAYRRGRPKR